MRDRNAGQYHLSRRAFLMSATIGMGSLSLAACSGGDQVTSSSSISEGNLKNSTIALILGQTTDPFYITMAKSARAEAASRGVHLLVDGPVNFDAAEQIPIVQKTMQKHISAMLIAACNKTALIEPLQRVQDVGIKVISVDTFIGNGDYVHGPVTFPLSYIGSDNLEGGRIVGDVLIKSIGGEGKIYIQDTTPGTSSTAQRVQGCKQAIAATNGAVTLVGVDYNYHSVPKSIAETIAIIEKVSDLAGIFGTSVGSAEGISQGVKNANKLGAIKIASFDAPEQAITDLRNGVIDILLAQKPADMGRIAVDYAVDALNGNTNAIQKLVHTGFVIIDKDNIDTPEAQAAIYVNNY
jgi:ribose transport system substrate-binding protein